jgi:hypothetical protein
MLGDDFSAPTGSAFAEFTAAPARVLRMQSIATDARIIRVDILLMAR